MNSDKYGQKFLETKQIFNFENTRIMKTENNIKKEIHELIEIQKRHTRSVNLKTQQNIQQHYEIEHTTTQYFQNYNRHNYFWELLN